MELTPATKIGDLLQEYPFLTDFLKQQSPKYSLLDSSLARKTLGKVATLSQVAAVGGLDLNALMADMAGEITAKTGQQVAIITAADVHEAVTGGAPVTGAPASGTGPATDADREARQERLKEIIRDLHAGAEMPVLKQRFQELISDVDATEIARMEQALIAEGMPESEIKRLCDVHVEVFKESLGKQGTVSAPPGHPVHTFMQENRAAEEIMREILGIVEKLCDSQDADFLRAQGERLQESLGRLSQIDLHYLRKENQLFPRLEDKGISGPTQVMWAIHDDIRGTLKTARAELEAAKVQEAANSITYAARSIADMIYKEENILFPMCMEKLTDADWQQVRQGEEEIGYAWIRPEEAGPAPGAGDLQGAAAASGLLDLQTGRLSLQQLDLMLAHLPLELSFVDEQDEVRYFSQRAEKIFPRSPGVIGRRVQNCHPSRSLAMVQRILDEFRAGTRDTADFWIEMDCRFILIRYLAVRDDAGAYRGTLEVVQDVTAIRGLTGQRRLLDWDEQSGEEGAEAAGEPEPPGAEPLPEQPGF